MINKYKERNKSLQEHNYKLVKKIYRQQRYYARLENLTQKILRSWKRDLKQMFILQLICLTAGFLIGMMVMI